MPQLKPKRHQGELLHEVAIGGHMWTVVMQAHCSQRGWSGVPVSVAGVPHYVKPVYNINNHQHELYLFAGEGPYEGYKGHQLWNQEIEVSEEAFARYFSFKLWKYDRGSLWVAQERTYDAAVKQVTDDNWSSFVPMQPPVEMVPVTRDGRNGFEELHRG